MKLAVNLGNGMR